jgi:hypothetical protein
LERTGETALRSAGDQSTVGDVRRYTRLEAVERQIEMAIRAHLQFDDAVSAVTLSGAAERVLSDLSPCSEWSDDSLSIKSFIEKFAKGNEKAVAKHLRKPINMLKHAEDDPNVDHLVDLHWLETLLMMTVREFYYQTKKMTPAMHAFRFWCAAKGRDWNFTELMNEDEIVDLKETYGGWSDSEIFLGAVAYYEAKSLIPSPSKRPPHDPRRRPRL